MRWVIVPGIDGSDDRHWQSLWERSWGSSACRTDPTSWAEPDAEDWIAAVGRAVRGPAGTAPDDTVLIAHSIGCLAATAWQARTGTQVRGLFLVAPPDRAGDRFPRAQATSFAGLAETPVTVPGLVVASTDDPFCSLDAAHRIAGRWGLACLSAGPHGHLNSTSGLGTWPSGRALLDAFVAGTERP